MVATATEGLDLGYISVDHLAIQLTVRFVRLPLMEGVQFKAP